MYSFADRHNVLGGIELTTLKSAPYRHSYQPSESFSPTTDFDEILPKLSLADIRERISTDRIYYPEDDDPVQAKFVELADSKGIFLNKYSVSLLNPEKPAKHFIISLLDGGTPKVHPQLLDNIEPGDFLIVRTEGGGGDYIEFVADLILDKEASRCRESQKEWKSLLKQVIDTRGIQKVAQELSSLKCQSANEVNLRNWFDSKSIMPESKMDFQILLAFLHLQTRFDDIFALMLKIRTAHHQAGSHIRKRILAQIQDISSAELSSLPSKEFKIGDQSGTLTAFQVTSVRREDIEVRLSEIQTIVEMD